MKSRKQSITAPVAISMTIDYKYYNILYYILFIINGITNNKPITKICIPSCNLYNVCD